MRSASVRDPARSDAGYVTAETAMVLPVLLLVVGVMLTLITGLVDRIRCVDAARIGVRALERGESRDAVLAHVRAAAPRGARVETRDDGPLVAVTVTAPLAFHGALGLLDVVVRGDASGAREPGSDTS